MPRAGSQVGLTSDESDESDELVQVWVQFVPCGIITYIHLCLACGALTQHGVM